MPSAQPDRPNILFVFPDQLSARWLPCYGGSVVQAPVLDRFAAGATRVDQAYTTSPLCTPYRGCLMTGLYPSQSGVLSNGDPLPAGVTTLADRLHAAGYDTRYVGKWHLGGDPQALRWVPPEERGGFRHFIGWESHHVNHNAGVIFADESGDAMDMRGHETDGLTDIACEQLRLAAQQGDPFFMAVSYQAPHPPCSPPDADYARYDSGVLAEPPTTDPVAWYRMPHWEADYDIEEFRKRYFGEITQIDRAFGRLLDQLDTLGLAEDTWVVFTSDHGEMAGCHGLFGKGVMYDEAVRVPLLIRRPGQTAGQVLHAAPVATVDLHQTLLQMAGAEPGPEGQGFLAALADGDTADAAPVFIEHRQDEDCIIAGRLKLVVPAASDQPTAAYQLDSDPFEERNLLADLPAATRDPLLAQLGAWRRRVRG